MTDLCPSCQEPLDYPSGDGCAAMTRHKEKPMSDYNLTRSVAGKVVTRFASMLEDLEDDYEDEIVVSSLVNYFHTCSQPDKIDNTGNEYIEPDEDLLWAIDRVLQDYMTPDQYSRWKKRLRWMS